MNMDLFYLSDTDFPISIIEHQKQDIGEMFQAHSHKNQIQLIYLMQGTCQIYCNTKQYLLIQNDLILIHPEEVHYGTVISIPLHYYVIRLDLALLDNLCPEVCHTKYILPIFHGFLSFHHHIKSKSIKEISTEIIQIGKTKELGYELQLMNYCYLLLVSLVQHQAVYLPTEVRTEYLMRKRKRFEFVFLYIKEHLADNLTTSLLAEKANMSVAYFCRYFKECTNETPINYVNKLRLDKAVILLNQGNLSITEISYTCGFHDSNYFSRVFRKYMNQTPSEFLLCSRKLRI